MAVQNDRNHWKEQLQNQIYFRDIYLYLNYFSPTYQ